MNKHLSVYKQIAYIKLNHYCYIEIPGTIYLCTNYGLILNRIISDRWQYLKPFNCVQTNELWLN